MKRLAVIFFVLTSVLFCSCSSESNRTSYDTDLYWGMSKSDANSVVSEKYISASVGDTIACELFKNQDFLHPEEPFNKTPSVILKFEKDKLIEISHKYDYPSKTLPENTAEQFNKYLCSALNTIEADISENNILGNNGDIIYSVKMSYYKTENEDIWLTVSSGVIGDTIEITYKPL